MFKSKKFSIIKLFNTVGYLMGEYDEDHDKFKKSFRSFFKSHLTLILTEAFILKMPYCYTLDSNDRLKQLIVGDLFYYFNQDSKFWITVIGLN